MLKRICYRLHVATYMLHASCRKVVQLGFLVIHTTKLLQFGGVENMSCLCFFFVEKNSCMCGCKTQIMIIHTAVKTHWGFFLC